MKESKQQQLSQELGDFFEHISQEYGVGVGMLALDLGKNGDVILGMMFGRKSQLNNHILNRLQETCDSTIKGARAEYGVKDEEDIELPDTNDKKAMAEFILKHDLLGDDGQVSKEKTDALFNKLIEQKKREYIERFIFGDK